MKKLLFFILTVVMLVMTGCNPKVITTSKTVVRDSVVITEIPRAHRIGIEADQVPFEVVINCDPVTNLPVPVNGSWKSGRSSATIKMDSTGTLKGLASCDSLTKVVEVMEKQIRHTRSEKEVKTVKVEVFKTRWYDIAARWVSAVVLLLIILKLTILKF